MATPKATKKGPKAHSKAEKAAFVKLVRGMPGVRRPAK